MGGIGSGRQGGRYRLTTDRALRLVVPDLIQENGEGPSSLWIGSSVMSCTIALREEQGALGLAYVANGRPIKDAVFLETTKPHFGGVRWWATCPGCGERVAVLFLPYGHTLFRCRRCHDLTYPCQREATTSRAIRRARKLRTRLGGGPGLFDPIPFKPRGRWWKTWHRDLERLDHLDAAVDAAIETFIGVH